MTGEVLLHLEALRALEIYGYQAAYYILQDQQLAVEATSAALIELAIGECRFTGESPERQRELMKRAIMKASLGVKRKTTPTQEVVN